jgi:hypothetical protein
MQGTPPHWSAQTKKQNLFPFKDTAGFFLEKRISVAFLNYLSCIRLFHLSGMTAAFIDTIVVTFLPANVTVLTTV